MSKFMTLADLIAATRAEAFTASKSETPKGERKRKPKAEAPAPPPPPEPCDVATFRDLMSRTLEGCALTQQSERDAFKRRKESVAVARYLASKGQQYNPAAHGFALSTALSFAAIDEGFVNTTDKAYSRVGTLSPDAVRVEPGVNTVAKREATDRDQALALMNQLGGKLTDLRKRNRPSDRETIAKLEAQVAALHAALYPRK